MPKITALELEQKIKETGKRTQIGCGGGLIVEVTAAGSAFYVCSYRDSSGKQRREKIGTYGKMQLKTAFAECEKLKTQRRREELEQATQAQTQKASITWAPAVEEWLEDFKDPLKHKNLKRYMTVRSQFKHLSTLDSTALSQLTPHIIKKAFDALSTARQQWNISRSVSQFLGWAQVMGYLDAALLLQLRAVMRQYKRQPSEGFNSAHSSELVTKFFQPLAHAEYMIRVFYLTVLFTALREGSALALRWEWIDMKQGIITLPGEVMKMGRPFRVPIPAQLAALFDTYRQGCIPGLSFVFPGRRDPEHTHLAATHVGDPIRVNLPRSANGQTEVTIHGLRSSVRVWMRENGIDDRTAEMCLAHEESNSVVKAYLRTDLLEERRQAMQRWCDFIAPQLPPEYKQCFDPDFLFG